MADRTPLPSSFEFEGNQQFTEETGWQKFKRRLREEPLIPLGCAATCYALYRAYKSMKARDSEEMNRMFRARIYAQFFTLLAAVAGGIYYKNERQQRREFEKMVEARKLQEKREAWLRELEHRDREDREWRERHRAMEESAKKAAAAASGKLKDASAVVVPSSTATTAARTDEDGGITDDEGKKISNKGDQEESSARGLGIVEAVKGLTGKK
ncbi:hypothetical protein VTN31DRAFT_4526 [Thermomyces dupontii]|uniref:uncharacterized protein n=1 Tax=Talaromyces thermophilus TaxID=28565 RepID=UPI0037421D3E